ncbi:glycosyltransferase family 2 protein [Desulfotignum balticum]|uniref:glycosyltransferase family 2 protein n=1 Tax=Desulfotignum balticum TaxID=115781 RepID=UPI000418E230|nr:glycosyltransferase family 2 protein [Desulfotignum balticum]
MKTPFVVVLILSYNGKHLLEEAIVSYSNNNYNNFKIVVIDNGSNDGTLDFMNKNFKDINVLRIEKNRGYSGGFNFGLDYAFNKLMANYVLITNNDVKVDTEVVASLVEVAEKKEDTGFVTGKVYFYDNPGVLQTVGKSGDQKYWRSGHIGAKAEDKGQFDVEKELDWCDDIFWLVSKKVFKETGGYDTSFQFQAEDFDWQVRSKIKGFKIYYAPKAKIWHKDSMTIGKDSSFKAYYNFRNPLIVHMKYRKWSEYKFYFYRKLKALIISSIKNIVKFRFVYVYKSWKGFFSAIFWLFKNKIFFPQQSSS